MTRTLIFKNIKNSELIKITDMENNKIFFESIDKNDERTADTYISISFDNAVKSIKNAGYVEI